MSIVDDDLHRDHDHDDRDLVMSKSMDPISRCHDVTKSDVTKFDVTMSRNHKI